MKFNLLSGVLSLLVLLLSGCGPAAEEPVTQAPTQAEDVAAMNALADEHEAAMSAGDAAAVAALFTENAIRMPPNEPALVGRQAIQSRSQSSFDEADYQVTVPVAEVVVAGDWAFARGTYIVTVTLKASGEATQDNGKYLNICRREPDGSWGIYRNIWNSNIPVPGTEE